MKNLITKYLASGLLLLSVSLSSCVKERNAGATDFSGLNPAPYVEIVEGGLAQFGSGALLFPAADVSDTIWFRLNYAGKNVAPNDVVITLGYDAAALAAYNSANPASPYLKMPDSINSFPVSKVTIKAGQSYSAPVAFVLKPNKVDPSVNYMFPISILDASGVATSGNFNTIYYHLIGNPLAGNYTWRYRRFQGADTTIVPLQDITQATGVPPISPTQLMTPETYTQTFISPNDGIVLSFTNTAGTLSGFQPSLDATTIAAIPANSFVLIDGPKFTAGGFHLVGSSSTHYIGTNFSIYIEYQNSTPAFRSLVNTFTKIP